MSVIRELALKLGLEVDSASMAEGIGFEKALEKGLEKIVDVAKEVAEAIKENIKDAIEYGDKVNKAAQSIGIARGALQELQYVGELADVGAQEMAQSIGLLSKNMYAASKGGEEQAKVFAKLGVQLKGSDGKLRSADEVLGDIAEKFSTMPDGVEKTALALETFGRAGKQMIPFLNEGREGLEELRQEARDLGLVMSDESVKASEELNDNLARLRVITQGLWRQAIAPLIPAINELVVRFMKWRKENAAIMAQRIQAVMGALIKTVKLLTDALGLVVDNLDAIKIAAISLTAVWAVLHAEAVAAAIATAAAWAIAALPFAAIAAAIAGILIFLDDIRVYRENKGGKSIFGLWADTIKEWQKPNPNDPWWLKAIKELVELLERALGVYNKMHGIFEPEKSRGLLASPMASKTGASVPSFTGAKNFEVPKPYISVPENQNAPGTFWYGYARARAAGVGVFGALTTRNAEFAESPMLPPGGGVTAAPMEQNNYRSYVIYQSPGMSPEAVRDAIEAHEDEANEAAAAALSE